MLETASDRIATIYSTSLTKRLGSDMLRYAGVIQISPGNPLVAYISQSSSAAGPILYWHIRVPRSTLQAVEFKPPRQTTRRPVPCLLMPRGLRARQPCRGFVQGPSSSCDARVSGAWLC